MAETKNELLDALKALVRTDLEVAIAAAKATKEGATHEENKPENDKDTRAIEASYLAGAQGARVRDLEQTLAAFEGLPVRAFAPGDPIGAGAIVRLRSAREELVCLFAPLGGGLKAPLGGHAVQVVTPKSPLGQAMLGAREGDEIEVELGKTVKTYDVLAVE